MGARNRVVVPARQAALADGFDSFESVSEILKSLKFRALGSACTSSLNTGVWRLLDE